MKFNIFCIILLSNLHFTKIDCQTSFGVKGGYTLVWPNYGNVELPENAETSLNGFNIGLIFIRQLYKKISIGIEPSFIKRGAACKPGWQPIFRGDSRLLLNYLELPVMVGLNQSLFNNKLEVSLKAGYGISRLLTAYREEFDISNPSDAVRTKLDLNDPLATSLSKYDHGFYSGLVAGYNFSTFQIFLESVYYNGFKNIDSQNYIKTRSLSLNTGIKINL